MRDEKQLLMLKISTVCLLNAPKSKECDLKSRVEDENVRGWDSLHPCEGQ